MSETEQATIEQHVLRVTAKQAVTYLWGLAVLVFLGSGAYFGITYQLKDIKNDMAISTADRAALRQDINAVRKQNDDRYVDIKLELDRKQDKRP